MINCRKCTTIPEFNLTEADVYISLPTHLHVDVFHTFMHEKGLVLEELDNAFLVKVNSFESFVFALADECFNMMEQKDVMMLPLHPNTSLSFAVLPWFKSLFHWNVWFKGTVLIDILQRKSLKIEFQPIVDVMTMKIYGYEALSRGIREDGTTIMPLELFTMAKNMDLLFHLDRMCREKIIAETYKHSISKKVFINFNPNAIYDPEKCLRSTINEINR